MFDCEQLCCSLFLPGADRGRLLRCIYCSVSFQIIDATQKGNCSRFMNHSCEPNCETQKVKCWIKAAHFRGPAPFLVISGFPQGSILGPALLNSFSSDVDRGSEGALSECADREGLEGVVGM